MIIKEKHWKLLANKSLPEIHILIKQFQLDEDVLSYCNELRKRENKRRHNEDGLFKGRKCKDCGWALCHCECQPSLTFEIEKVQEKFHKQLVEKFQAQEGKCALSGVKLTFGRNGNASLDRIDPSKYYVEGNMQWVHKSVNKMKGGYPVNTFKKFCKLVGDNS